MVAGAVPIGERIAILRRRRGLSQAAVAERLGRSEQWLSNIERGVRGADRHSVLVPIADMLGVSVAELTGDGPSVPVRSGARREAARAVRLALARSGFVGPAPQSDRGNPAVLDLDHLRSRVRHVWQLVHAARYEELEATAPDLVQDCERAVRQNASEPGEDAFRLLADLYQAIAAMLAKLGEPDAAWVAADRSTAAASRAGDTVLVAAGGFRLGHAFLQRGALDDAERAVDAAAEALRPGVEGGDPEALTMWGALSLVKAITAARQGDRGGSEAALARAMEAVHVLGPRHRDERFDTEFGAQNVALHAVSVAVELGDAAEALRRFGHLDVNGLSAERRARLLVDVARAHAQRRDGRAAFRALEDGERLAPELVRHHWLARETVRELLRRERGRAKADRLELAARMGLLQAS